MSDSSAGDHPAPDPQSAPPAYPPPYPGGPAPQAGPPQPGHPQAYPQPGYPQAYPQPGYPTYAQPGYPAYGVPAADPDKRPTTVTVAAVITWICTALTVLVGGLLLVAAAAGSDAMFDDFIDATDNTFSRAEARTILLVTAVVLIVWAGSAAVLAVLAFRRRNWARITLVVSAGISLPFELVAVGAVLPGLLLLITIAVIVLLFTGGANAWYRRTATPAPVY